MCRGFHRSSTGASSFSGFSCSQIGVMCCRLHKQHKSYGVVLWTSGCLHILVTWKKTSHILTSLAGNVILACIQVPGCVCWRSWETGYQQRTAVQCLLEKDVSEHRWPEYLFQKEWLHPATPWTLTAMVKLLEMYRVHRKGAEWWVAISMQFWLRAKLNLTFSRRMLFLVVLVFCIKEQVLKFHR